MLFFGIVSEVSSLREFRVAVFTRSGISVCIFLGVLLCITICIWFAFLLIIVLEMERIIGFPRGSLMSLVGYV